MYAPYINTDRQMCLGINSSNNGIDALCTFVHDQAWYRGSELGTTDFYQYINGYGKCLGVAYGSNKAGSNVVSNTCLGSGHHDQYWQIHYLSGQTYECELFNYHSALLMMPISSATNAAVVIEPYDGQQNIIQEWVFEINS